MARKHRPNKNENENEQIPRLIKVPTSKPPAVRLRTMHSMFGVRQGEKCGDCLNLVTNRGRYKKCNLTTWGRSERTDWRVSWLACGAFVPRGELPTTPKKKRGRGSSLPEALEKLEDKKP